MAHDKQSSRSIHQRLKNNLVRIFYKNEGDEERRKEEKGGGGGEGVRGEGGMAPPLTHRAGRKRKQYLPGNVDTTVAKKETLLDTFKGLTVLSKSGQKQANGKLQ